MEVDEVEDGMVVIIMIFHFTYIIIHHKSVELIIGAYKYGNRCCHLGPKTN